MFVGDYRAKLDAKGRFIFPAALRRQQGGEARPEFAIRRGIYAPCLVIYTRAEFEKQVEEVQKRVNVNSREGDRFIREFCRSVELVALDASDRLQLSKRASDYLESPSGTLVLVGQFDRIELWDADRYEAAQLDEQSYEELSERLLGGEEASHAG